MPDGHATPTRWSIRTCRLNGFDNLFVVDASVFPALPSGPINAAVVAVAETWAAAQR